MLAIKVDLVTTGALKNKRIKEDITTLEKQIREIDK